MWFRRSGVQFPSPTPDSSIAAGTWGIVPARRLLPCGWEAPCAVYRDPPGRVNRSGRWDDYRNGIAPAEPRETLGSFTPHRPNEDSPAGPLCHPQGSGGGDLDWRGGAPARHGRPPRCGRRGVAARGGFLPDRPPPRPSALHPAKRTGGAEPCAGARLGQRARRPPRHVQGAGDLRDPLLHLLGRQGDHRHGDPQARRTARPAPGGPGLRIHPRVRPPRQAVDHAAARARSPRGHPEPSARLHRPGPARPAGPGGGHPLRRQDEHATGKAARLSRDQRRLRAGRGGAQGHRQRHPHRSGQGDLQAAGLPLDELRRGGRRHRRGWP